MSEMNKEVHETIISLCRLIRKKCSESSDSRVMSDRLSEVVQSTAELIKSFKS